VDFPGLMNRRAAEAEPFQKPVAAVSQSMSALAILSSDACDFWAVWCVNENCFLPEIYLQALAAQTAAQKHGENRAGQTTIYLRLKRIVPPEEPF